MIHKETFLRDAEWREVLAKALASSSWGGRPLEDMIVSVLAAAKGEKDGPAWLVVLEMQDGTKPVVALKHREGEIPSEERERVPGNNLAFFVTIGHRYYGTYEIDFAWLAYDDELKRLGLLSWKRRKEHLLRKVCNRRGLKCHRRAVLTIGDSLWFCEKHAPASWPKHRASVLEKLKVEAYTNEELARSLASKDGEDWAVEIQTLLHMADAIRKRHRVLSRRKCWTLLSAPGETAHVGG